MRLKSMLLSVRGRAFCFVFFLDGVKREKMEKKNKKKGNEDMYMISAFYFNFFPPPPPPAAKEDCKSKKSANGCMC